MTLLTQETIQDVEEEEAEANQETRSKRIAITKVAKSIKRSLAKKEASTTKCAPKEVIIQMTLSAILQSLKITRKKRAAPCQAEAEVKDMAKRLTLALLLQGMQVETKSIPKAKKGETTRGTRRKKTKIRRNKENKGMVKRGSPSILRGLSRIGRSARKTKKVRSSTVL